MNNVSLIRHVCGGWNFGLSETPHLLAVVNLYYLRIIKIIKILLHDITFVLIRFETYYEGINNNMNERTKLIII